MRFGQQLCAEVALGRLDITPRVMIAGCLATLGGFLNAWLYAWMTEKVARGSDQEGGASGVWIFCAKSNFSTSVGQLLNTALFMTVAFAGILPNVWLAIIVVWVLKVLAAFVGVPFLVAGRRLYVWRERLRCEPSLSGSVA